MFTNQNYKTIISNHRYQLIVNVLQKVTLI
jgi:hypothetical protein